MSYIWVPRVQIIEPRDPIAIGVRCEGRFTFAKVLADGTRIELPGVSGNLILNTGLDHIGTFSPGEPSFVCAIGTGTATPQVTDTALTSPVWTATTQSTGGSYIAGPPIKRRWTKTFRFAIGALNGNYSEVGIGPSSGVSLFSRALIVDGNGTPTTITVESDKSLDVTYTFDEVVATGDTAFSVNLSGTTYSGFARRRYAATSVTGSIINVQPWAAGGARSAFTGTLPAYDASSSPSGYIGEASSSSNQAYSNGSYARVLSLIYGQNNGNGNIKSVEVITGGNAGAFAYGLQFDNPLQKDSSKVLTLNITVSWGRSA